MNRMNARILVVTEAFGAIGSPIWSTTSKSIGLHGSVSLSPSLVLMAMFLFSAITLGVAYPTEVHWHNRRLSRLLVILTLSALFISAALNKGLPAIFLLLLTTAAVALMIALKKREPESRQSRHSLH